MKKGTFPVDKFKSLETPFYYYDMELLKQTLKIAKDQSKKHGYLVHYAIKANANKKILETIATAGFGADCVSGNEVKAAFLAGFPPSKIVFAGVGKTDKEIGAALDMNIACFNVESLPELEAINSLAKKKGKTANIALRINPNVDAETHAYITTGVNENKFGFSMNTLPKVLKELPSLKNIQLIGIHFHIGSQITNMDVYERLCKKAAEIREYFENNDIQLEHINLGGGLGVDYENPTTNSIPDFESYFNVFANNFETKSKQCIHFELGRSFVCQCGSLISKITYVKEGESKKFAIIDGSMTELIRPALYEAYHKIENLTSDLPDEKYDVVGPICESSDSFVKDYNMNGAKRGDIIAIRSAGAYGEVMASRYNCRELPKAYYSDLI